MLPVGGRHLECDLGANEAVLWKMFENYWRTRLNTSSFNFCFTLCHWLISVISLGPLYCSIKQITLTKRLVLTLLFL